MIAFLFAGQGTDLSHIAAELTQSVPEVADLIDVAASEVGVPIARLWHQGGRLLESTEVYQPVFIAVTLGITAALRRSGMTPRLCAGHSLGELAAWSAAGCLSPRAAIRIARVRGRLMARRAAELRGGMLALRGDAARELVAAESGLHVAAHNAPDEVVVAGNDDALNALAARLPATRLPVPGPWHSPGMAPIVDELAAVLATVETRPLEVPLVSGVTGGLVTDGTAMRSLLARQLVEPVRWVDAMATIARCGITDIVTVGPGRYLRGLVRGNHMTNLRLHATERPDLICRTAAALCV